MKRYNVKCFHCQSLNIVEETKAGTKINCENCNNIINVPTYLQTRDLIVDEVQSATDDSPNSNLNITSNKSSDSQPPISEVQRTPTEAFKPQINTDSDATIAPEKSSEQEFTVISKDEYYGPTGSGFWTIFPFSGFVRTVFSIIAGFYIGRSLAQHTVSVNIGIQAMIGVIILGIFLLPILSTKIRQMKFLDLGKVIICATPIILLTYGLLIFSLRVSTLVISENPPAGPYKAVKYDKSGMYGYFVGEVPVILPEYKRAWDFQGDLAVVKTKDEQFFVIDKSNTKLLELPKNKENPRKNNFSITKARNDLYWIKTNDDIILVRYHKLRDNLIQVLKCKKLLGNEQDVQVFQDLSGKIGAYSCKLDKLIIPVGDYHIDFIKNKPHDANAKHFVSLVGNDNVQFYDFQGINIQLDPSQFDSNFIIVDPSYDPYNNDKRKVFYFLKSQKYVIEKLQRYFEANDRIYINVNNTFQVYTTEGELLNTIPCESLMQGKGYIYHWAEQRHISYSDVDGNEILKLKGLGGTQVTRKDDYFLVYFNGNGKIIFNGQVFENPSGIGLFAMDKSSFFIKAGVGERGINFDNKQLVFRDETSGKYGILDFDGKELITAKYDFLTKTATGEYTLKDDNHYGILNPENLKLVNHPPLSCGMGFSQTRNRTFVVYHNEKRTYGLMDMSGKLIVKPEYQSYQRKNTSYIFINDKKPQAQYNWESKELIKL
ncbi:MAG: WG repeat-containing protein [Lentisphaeria bacterium]|nr:WG repeat-containing protein [Lentisphaeria bacterium]